jgi:response regulator RpfG family c-di-GMP phosphodiesterase
MQNIYIVDDDRNIVEALTIVLESANYNVSCQYHQEDVVKNSIEFGSDLIILDVMFPEDQNAGFKIARNLKNNNDTQDIPILMLSAVNEKGLYAGTFSNKDRDDSFLPVQEFIEKPIVPKLLLEKVSNLLKQ